MFQYQDANTKIDKDQKRIHLIVHIITIMKLIHLNLNLFH